MIVIKISGLNEMLDIIDEKVNTWFKEHEIECKAEYSKEWIGNKRYYYDTYFYLDSNDTHLLYIISKHFEDSGVEVWMDGIDYFKY